MQILTDSEFAVTLDSLSAMRETLRDLNQATPNIDSALAKLTNGILPSTNGIRFELING